MRARRLVYRCEPRLEAHYVDEAEGELPEVAVESRSWSAQMCVRRVIGWDFTTHRPVYGKALETTERMLTDPPGALRVLRCVLSSEDAYYELDVTPSRFDGASGYVEVRGQKVRWVTLRHVAARFFEQSGLGFGDFRSELAGRRWRRAWMLSEYMPRDEARAAKAMLRSEMRRALGMRPVGVLEGTDEARDRAMRLRERALELVRDAWHESLEVRSLPEGGGLRFVLMEAALKIGSERHANAFLGMAPLIERRDVGALVQAFSAQPDDSGELPTLTRRERAWLEDLTDRKMAARPFGA